MVKNAEINNKINSYNRLRNSSTRRYAAFDLCYEYFYNNRRNLIGNNLQTSCCQLWAYLASWGMVMRGNELQRSSYAILTGVVKYIHSHSEYYNVKIEDKNYIDKILELYDGIDKALDLKEQKNKKTLITKIILGVYACCPAFDSRFCRTFGTSTSGRLSKRNLQSVVDFYKKHKLIFDNICFYTLHFDKKEKNPCLKYTPAKLIDMYGFERNEKM